MDAFSKITDIADASGDVEAPPDDAAQLAKVAGLMGKKPAGGADPWRGTLVAAGAKPIKPTIVVGDHRSSKWAHIRQELTDVGIGVDDASQAGLTKKQRAKLLETQREILAMGKEAWIAKIDEARIQRKLSGVIAILMALAVSYYAGEMFVIVDDSGGKVPAVVRLIVFCSTVWALITLLFLLRQCASDTKHDNLLDRARQALEDREIRQRQEAREARHAARGSRDD